MFHVKHLIDVFAWNFFYSKEFRICYYISNKVINDLHIKLPSLCYRQSVKKRAILPGGVLEWEK